MRNGTIVNCRCATSPIHAAVATEDRFQEEADRSLRKLKNHWRDRFLRCSFSVQTELPGKLDHWIPGLPRLIQMILQFLLVHPIGRCTLPSMVIYLHARIGEFRNGIQK